MSYPKILHILILSICSLAYGSAQVDYTNYEAILIDNVSPTGEVDYASIIKNDKNKFNKFLQQLSSVDPDKLSQNQELAFWINVYNAYTIKMIIDHWPVKSIMDISDGKPWDIKWIPVNGQIYSLNQIENDIIRPTFQDPRIHFAVNCAAKSCPPLLNAPFTGDQIEQQLEQRTKSFINNDNYNQLTQNLITVSMIFDWYKSDFGNLIDFINKYSKTDINSGGTIRYTSYNWALND